MNRVWMAIVGGFFVVWGGWEFLEVLGVVPEARFPWQLLIVFLGGAFLVGAVTGRGWSWWCDEGERGARAGPPK